jgi:hypothetical protein
MPAKLLPDGSGDSSVFEPLVGQTSQGSWIGYGSTLFLHFGELVANPKGLRNPPREWWAEAGTVWRLERADAIVTASEDARDLMENGIHELDGLQFRSGHYISGTRDAILRFSGEVILRTFQIDVDEDHGCWGVYRHEEEA